MADKYMDFEEILDCIVNRSDVFETRFDMNPYNMENAVGRFMERNRGNKDIMSVLDETLQHSPMSDKSKRLVIEYVRAQVEQTADAQNFLHRLILVSDVYRGTRNAKNNPAYVNKFCLVLQNLSTIKDEKLRYQALKRLGDDIERQSVLRMIAQNKYATVYDYYELLREGELNNAEYQALVSDICQKLEEDIKKYTNIETLDPDKLDRAFSVAEAIGDSVKHKYPQLGDQIKQRFNREEIIKVGTEEYFAKYNETQDGKIVELTAQNKKLQEQNAEMAQQIEALRQMLEQQERQSQEDQNKIKSLQQENKQLHGENVRVSAEKAKEIDKLRQLQEAAKKMKAGLGSSGVNDFKKLVEGMDEPER